jgi:hypothetical protein
LLFLCEKVAWGFVELEIVCRFRLRSSARHLSVDGVDALPGQGPNIFGHVFNGDVANAIEIKDVLQVALDMSLKGSIRKTD